MRKLLVLVTVTACAHAPQRTHEMTVTKPVAKVTVTVAPSEEVAWVITAANEGDAAIELDWDHSTFVDSHGRSYGRLLRGHTRRMNDGSPQMKSSIPPHARIEEWCVAEAMVDFEPDRTNLHGPPQPPEAVRNGVGRMVITFETANGKAEWEGSLSFDGTKVEVQNSADVPKPPTPPTPRPPADTEEPPAPTR